MIDATVYVTLAIGMSGSSVEGLEAIARGEVEDLIEQYPEMTVNDVSVTNVVERDGE